jgi:conjugal transfer pilus assembly protein TraK
MLQPGASQRARANEDLLGPLVEEERAVSITLSMLQDRIPASFTPVAPMTNKLALSIPPGASIEERRRVEIEGAGLSASEYLVTVASDVTLDERSFLVPALGANIFAVTLDRSVLKAGETVRLVIVRREAVQ